mmetsp:Transcript_49034/g.136270  ORF Transcript_49034/g.136270 Transcript_49034/m.136270 type:complete len:208 (-) Transcript_49034:1005-1628(-)
MAQSRLWHGAMLQPRSSTRLEGQCSPPSCGGTTTWRCRACWPPPQDLSHSSQAVHWETTQSAACWHGVTSLRVALQGIPSFLGSLRTFRSRSLLEPAASPAQSLHEPQSPTMQGRASPPHSMALHTLSSCSAPSHSSPPRSAGVSSPRSRVRRPPPQLCEQVDQADQRPKPQGTASAGGALQEAVSSRLPSHSRPPLEACCSTARLR